MSDEVDDRTMDSADWLSRDGARELCLQIMTYWHGRGYQTARAYPVRYGKSDAWGIRSNIRPLGFPPVTKAITGGQGEIDDQ